MKSMNTLVTIERFLGATQVGVTKAARCVRDVTYKIENVVLDAGYKVRRAMKKLPQTVQTKCIKIMLGLCKAQAKARKDRLKFIALESEKLAAEKKKLEKATAEYTLMSQRY
jgi:hypothetical protein